MNDLRSEIRAAFEEEQAMNPPAPNLRYTILRNIRTLPRRRETARWQWVAVAATLVLAALVVVGLLATRMASRNVPGHPQASPKSVADYGTPPAGVPLIYLAEPSHPGWYVGFDWSGKPRGTIKLAQPVDNGVVLKQAPDGSAFVQSQAGKSGIAGDFLDRLGRPIPGTQQYVPGFVWADDNKHVCGAQLDPATHKWAVVTQLPGQALIRQPATALPGTNPYLMVVACSLRNDRAVLTYSVMNQPSELWVVRISDGATLVHQADWPANTVSNIVASRDASMIAVSSSKSDGYIAGPTASRTIIENADGSVYARLDPGYGVLAFSADNSAVLVSTTPSAAQTPTHLALVNLQNGAVVWRSDGLDALTGVLGQPDGNGFAVLFQNPSDTTLHPTVKLVIVHADGTTATVTGQYVRP